MHRLLLLLHLELRHRQVFLVAADLAALDVRVPGSDHVPIEIVLQNATQRFFLRTLRRNFCGKFRKFLVFHTTTTLLTVFCPLVVSITLAVDCLVADSADTHNSPPF